MINFHEDHHPNSHCLWRCRVAHHPHGQNYNNSLLTFVDTRATCAISESPYFQIHRCYGFSDLSDIISISRGPVIQLAVAFEGTHANAAQVDGILPFTTFDFVTILLLHQTSLHRRDHRSRQSQWSKWSRITCRKNNRHRTL